MRRTFGFLAALTLAVLGGCSSGQIIDDLPSGIGLPAGTPARPASPYEYPAVHNMPPPRATEPLSAEEQLKMEEELTRLRSRQERAEPADKKRNRQANASKPAKSAKKKPARVENGEGTGAKPNP